MQIVHIKQQSCQACVRIYAFNATQNPTPKLLHNHWLVEREKYKNPDAALNSIRVFKWRGLACRLGLQLDVAEMLCFLPMAKAIIASSGWKTLLISVSSDVVILDGATHSMHANGPTIKGSKSVPGPVFRNRLRVIVTGPRARQMILAALYIRCAAGVEMLQLDGQRNGL